VGYDSDIKRSGILVHVAVTCTKDYGTENRKAKINDSI
jgi:hypothetical protein